LRVVAYDGNLTEKRTALWREFESIWILNGFSDILNFFPHIPVGEEHPTQC